MMLRFVAVLVLIAASQASMAEERVDHTPAVCKSINIGSAKTDLTGLSEDELKEKMCLSSLSVVRTADPMAAMQCRLVFKALTAEFSRRHPGKEMAEVYGRC